MIFAIVVPITSGFCALLLNWTGWGCSEIAILIGCNLFCFLMRVNSINFLIANAIMRVMTNTKATNKSFSGALKSYLTIVHIGGHGFLDGVGVHTPGVCQKICRPPSAAKIFSRQPFHQGVILLNRNEKKCSPQGSICPIFFHLGGIKVGVSTFFTLGVDLKKFFTLGCTPPHPHPVPIYDDNYLGSLICIN